MTLCICRLILNVFLCIYGFANIYICLYLLYKLYSIWIKLSMVSYRKKLILIKTSIIIVLWYFEVKMKLLVQMIYRIRILHFRTSRLVNDFFSLCILWTRQFFLNLGRSLIDKTWISSEFIYESNLLIVSIFLLIRKDHSYFVYFTLFVKNFFHYVSLLAEDIYDEETFYNILCSLYFLLNL